MFCPKCASQNADEAKFCRGCGADVSNVLAVLEGRSPNVSPLAEKQIHLFSSALRSLIVGFGFLIVAFLGLVSWPRLMVALLFGVPFAFYFLGTGISRMVQARALRKLAEANSIESPAALSPGADDYIQPPRSIYQTDDLTSMPRSVTENTTRHLKMDPDTRERG